MAPLVMLILDWEKEYIVSNKTLEAHGDSEGISIKMINLCSPPNQNVKTFMRKDEAPRELLGGDTVVMEGSHLITSHFGENIILEPNTYLKEEMGDHGKSCRQEFHST